LYFESVESCGGIGDRGLTRLFRSARLAERIALIGNETLLGREVEDVLAHSTHRTPITPYAANAEGNFGSEEAEAVFVEAFDAAAVLDHRSIVLAGTEEGARKVYGLAKEIASPPTIIDCLAYLENEPEARIVSSADKLAEQPAMGRVGRVKGTRELVLADIPYIIPYRVVGGEIEILTVMHAAQRWPRQL